LPPSDASPEPVGIGKSNATVHRAGTTFVKTMAPTWDRGLDAEHARLQWLATTAMAGHAPEVVEFAAAEARLVTTAVAGVDAATRVERGDDGGDLARRMGAALRALHDGLDPSACPFDERLDAKLAACRRRIEEGGVDADDFEPEYAGRSPEQVLDELRATRPRHEDLVVTHGDWCWPNVVFDDENGGRWGMVDVGALGVACRWYDLGIGCRSTAHNAGDGAVAHFLAGYGVEADDERIRYYVLVDELQ
jgi:aminoglycoside 3'-phosphotransferase-2